MNARYVLRVFGIALICMLGAASASAQTKHPKPKAAAAKPATKTAAKPAPKAAVEASVSGEAAKGADAPHSASTSHEVVARESNIEFDERMVRGQTAAGAIYLFQRSPSEFKSIVHVPDSFRAKTVGMLAPRRAAP